MPRSRAFCTTAEAGKPAEKQETISNKKPNGGGRRQAEGGTRTVLRVVQQRGGRSLSQFGAAAWRPGAVASAMHACLPPGPSRPTDHFRPSRFRASRTTPCDRHPLVTTPRARACALHCFLLNLVRLGDGRGSVYKRTVPAEGTLLRVDLTGREIRRYMRWRW